MSRSFYTGTNGEMATGSATFKTIIAEEFAALGLTEAQSTNYGTLDSDFQAKYALTVEPSTRTSVTIEARNESRRVLKARAIFLADIIRSNPAVSNSQLLALGLSVRTARTPVPPPQVKPQPVIRDVDGRVVEIYIADPTNGDYRKPSGVSGVTVFTCTGPAPLPEGDAGWLWQGQTARVKKVKVEFANSVPGGTKVWIVCVYYNAKGEHGPASTAISTYLPMEDVAEAA